jgi:hypothetical protein
MEQDASEEYINLFAGIVLHWNNALNGKRQAKV